MILGSGLLLNSGMLRIWPSTLENTPVFGLMVAGRIIPFGGFEVAGAGVYIPAPEEASRGAIFESMVMLGWSGAVPLCWTSPNCSACRILGGHLGIYNLNVVRSIGRLLDHGSLSKPLPVVEDGDLIAIVRHMLHARGRDTVSVTKVKGQASEVDVEQGRVRMEDRLGNDEVDTAADFGRRHLGEDVTEVRRALLNVREFWYPIMLQLQRFMVAVSRVSVNHDGKGGSALDPLVWDQGSRRKRRKVDVRVNVDLAGLPGPPGFLHGPGGSAADPLVWDQGSRKNQRKVDFYI